MIEKDRDVLNALLEVHDRSHMTYTETEWNNLRELCQILEPFLIATDNLQAEKVWAILNLPMVCLQPFDTTTIMSSRTCIYTRMSYILI